MQTQLADLLAMLPEHKHEAFIHRLPAETARAIADLSSRATRERRRDGEAADVDEATLTLIAEAVWACLEE